MAGREACMKCNLPMTLQTQASAKDLYYTTCTVDMAFVVVSNLKYQFKNTDIQGRLMIMYSRSSYQQIQPPKPILKTNFSDIIRINVLVLRKISTLAENLVPGIWLTPWKGILLVVMIAQLLSNFLLLCRCFRSSCVLVHRVSKLLTFLPYSRRFI